MKTLTIQIALNDLHDYMAGIEDLLSHPAIGNDISGSLLSDLELELGLIKNEIDTLLTQVTEALCSSK